MKESPERRFQRAPCSFPCAFSLLGNSSPAEVISLSIGGAYFACQARPSVNSEVTFAIRMSDHCLIRGKGKVIWSVGKKKKIQKADIRLQPGFGVEFDQLSREDHEVIDAFVRRKLRILRSISHELNYKPRNVDKIKSLFSEIHPDESQHLNHIKKVVNQELRFFRLRK